MNDPLAMSDLPIEETISRSASSKKTFKKRKNTRPTSLRPLHIQLMTLVAFGGGLFVLPVFFGGVRESVFLIFEILIGGALIVAIPDCRTHFWKKSLFFFALAALFLTYVILQPFILAPPGVAFLAIIKGLSPVPLNQELNQGALLTAAFFFSAVAICRTALSHRPPLFLFKLVRLAGGCMALIALAQWFSDNGALFWIFYPENIFTSERARWPFVNPDHLGHFLLAPLFISWFELSKRSLAVLGESFSGHRKWSKQAIFAFLAGKHSQQKIFSLIMAYFWPIVITLALGATQSRGTYLGVGVGLLVSWGIRFCYPEAPLAEPLLNHSVTRSRQKRTNGRFHRYLPLMSRMLPFAISALLILLFLAGRGSELISQRMEYSLLSAKDDMRWQLYKDSLPLIKSNLLLGVGFGSWNDAYAALKSPLLSGINPVYLHSDPLQLLAEGGIIGALLCSLPFLFLIASLFRHFRGADVELRKLSSAVIASLLALLTAACVDFPWRIPAILFQTSALVSILLFYLDNIETSEPCGSNTPS